MHPAPPLLLACLVAALPAPARAQQVQRCNGPDGRPVYTDRRCSDLGAADRLPPPAAAAGARLSRGACPRTLSLLVGEIRAGIQGGDVNRLSAVYDWSGVSAASATPLFERLEAMVQRPLVDIAPVYAGPAQPTAPVATTTTTPAPAVPAPHASPPASGAAAWMPGWPSAHGTAPAAAPPGTDALPEPPPAAPPVRPRPVALRVEQTMGNSATPVRTVFGLRRTYGCFWIAL